MIPEEWKLHHIGYLVSNIEKSIASFSSLGFMVGDLYYDDERDADFCFLSNDGGVIELVHPKVSSDIYPLLKQYRNVPYHICFEVTNIDDAVTKLKDSGFLLFRDKQIASAISKTAQVVFLMHTSIGIIELVSNI